MVLISVCWTEFQKIDGECRQDTHSQYTSCAVQFVHKRRTHTQRARLKNCSVIFVRRKRICHLVLHVSHPWLIHLPFTTSTSSSSFTLPSMTQEHAAQSVQHEQLREHASTSRYISKLPQSTSCAIKNHSGMKNLQSGGNPRTTTPTGYEPTRACDCLKD